MIPSLIGGFMFLMPVFYNGAWTIPMGVTSDQLKGLIGTGMPMLLLTILTVGALLSISAALQPAMLRRRLPASYIKVFSVPRRWLLIRVLGTLCAWLIYLKLGPEFIWSDITGGVALYSLAGTIVTIFLCAAFLLPLLTDFGLMEFVGSLLQPVFKRLFTLPGRAAVDAMASWMAAAAVGVLITIDQYERGNYSRREAAVIATNFSITSLPFCLFVIEFIGLREHFFSVYATVVAIGISCAVMLPRLPPLRGLASDSDVWRTPAVEDPSLGFFARAVLEARLKAAHSPGLKDYLMTSLRHLLDIWVGLLPIVVLIGTLGLAIAEFTPLMQTLAIPLTPLLSWMGLPEAAAAAPTFVVGFFDMFLPAAIGQSIESEVTRFVIASVSLTQLIYLSEVGSLLLRSSLRLGLFTLLQLFVLRTIIGLPIAVLMARLILG